MNRKSTIIAVTLLALGSLSACTPRQIAAALESRAETQSAEPTVNATVDCNNFDIDVSGLHADDRLIVVVGSEPPYGPTVDASGVATAHIPIGISQQGYKFLAAVAVIHPGTDAKYVFEQDVDCTSG